MSTSEPLMAPNAASPAPPAPPRRKRPAAGRGAAFYPRAWPRPLTGCVSALSVCRCPPPAYRQALENYGAHCSAERWPAAAGASIPHDYDALATPPPPGGGCGCLSGELAAAGPPTPAIGDDDIERCGYLSWLCH